MAKRLHQGGSRWRPFLVLVTVACTCAVGYLFISPLLQRSAASSSRALRAHVAQSSVGEDGTGCCRGLEHTELWSDAVNWGSDFLVDSTQECCDACKANLKCNSWVYCGDVAKCGIYYRQVVSCYGIFVSHVGFAALLGLVFQYTSIIISVVY
jgi:hypothetical protein